MTITRTVLREQIKEVLVERILNGHYHPGDRLVEMQIAQEFGTSQAPVREALRDLESLRFVGSEAFRGTRVRSISRQELAEIYPVRAALEGLAAPLAVARARDDLLGRLPLAEDDLGEPAADPAVEVDGGEPARRLERGGPEAL